jgi:hypothetical protein
MGICIELLLYMVCDRGRIQRQRLYGLDIRVHVLNLHLFAMAAAHSVEKGGICAWQQQWHRDESEL